jgi:hypothetical protein
MTVKKSYEEIRNAQIPKAERRADADISNERIRGIDDYDRIWNRLFAKHMDQLTKEALKFQEQSC